MHAINKAPSIHANLKILRRTMRTAPGGEQAIDKRRRTFTNTSSRQNLIEERFVPKAQIQKTKKPKKEFRATTGKKTKC